MKFLNKLRQWLLVKLANGQPVAMNLRLTRGMYFQHLTSGFLFNVHVDYEAEWPIGPDRVGFYFSGDPNNKADYNTYPKD